MAGVTMAKVKPGDMVILEYTGRLASDGQVFDTTDESVARASGIYSQEEIYGPRHAIFAAGGMIPGIIEAILVSEPGKEQEFRIMPDKAFGRRAPELVRMIPEKEFHAQQIKPVPGMVVSLDNAMARVKSVTSGRVVVDFNHPFAGEEVVYRLRVHEIIADDQKKIERVLATLGVAAKISKTDKGTKEKPLHSFSIEFEKGTPAEKIARAKSAIAALMPGAGFSEKQK